MGHGFTSADSPRPGPLLRCGNACVLLDGQVHSGVGTALDYVERRARQLCTRGRTIHEPAHRRTHVTYFGMPRFPLPRVRTISRMAASVVLLAEISLRSRGFLQNGLLPNQAEDMVSDEARILLPLWPVNPSGGQQERGWIGCSAIPGEYHCRRLLGNVQIDVVFGTWYLIHSGTARLSPVLSQSGTQQGNDCPEGSTAQMRSYSTS